MNPLKHPLLFSLLLALIAGVSYLATRPEISLRDRDRLAGVNPAGDSVWWRDREVGDISLVKFAQLMRQKSDKGDSIRLAFLTYKDSVGILNPAGWDEAQFRRVFYNGRPASKWEQLQGRLPIRILPGGGFVARLDTMNGRASIYLPYEVLYSVMHYKGTLAGNDAASQEVSSQTPQAITITPALADSIIAAKSGKLIQTEGMVWQHVSALIAGAGPQVRNGSAMTQLCYLWRNAKQNWVYINDPYLADHQDRWRSASETIQTWYFDNAHSYSGDCDDFAILVASFARQVGFESRFVASYGARGGHAYAECFIPNDQWQQALKDIRDFFPPKSPLFYSPGENGNWLNLDWWADHIGGPYYQGTRIIYSDL